MRVLSLFDGISCGRVALERAGIPVEKYYASEIDKYAIQVAHAMYPDTVPIGNVCDIDFAEYIDKVDMVIGGSPCFPAGTLITTPTGLIPIENIKVGDTVLTHTGRWQKVLRTGSHITDKIQVLSGGGCANLVCTPEHPFYVREMKRMGHFNKRTLGTPYWLPASDIKKPIMVGSTFGNQPIKPYKNPDFWRLIGRYVGDGWFLKTKRKGRVNRYVYKVIICDSRDKIDELYELFSKFGKRFSYTIEQNLVKFQISQKRFVDFVEKNIGHGALNKRFPEILWQQPYENKKAFLDGYLAADGCCKNGQFRITSVSKRLIYETKQLVMDLFGVLPQVYYVSRPKTTKIQGRIVNQHDTWEIRWNAENKKQQNYMKDESVYWNYIRNNVQRDCRIRVYNLEVENDNSYLADTMIVHNCQDLSIAKQNREGLHGERSRLFW